jgi:hypothetical protein
MDERDMEEEGKNREREEWEIVRKSYFFGKLIQAVSKMALNLLRG